MVDRPSRPPSQQVRHPSSTRDFLQIDHDLATAAKRIIDGALALVPGESVAIVADETTRETATMIADTAIQAGAYVRTSTLEELAPRPHVALHASIRDALAASQASVLVVGFERNELAMRAKFVEVAAELKLRHAHIVGVTRASLIAGLAADPRRIAAVSVAVRVRIRPTSVINVRSATGTDLTVRCEPWCRWYETSGVIRPGQKANLPAGELVTSPGDVDGLYVADGSVGDSGGTIESDLHRSPIRLEIERGIIRKIESSNLWLSRHLTDSMRSSSNLDRVGLVSFGTNIGLLRLADDIFTNQKLPSFHLSLGLPFPGRSGASWTAKSWIAFTATRSDVDVDGVAVMRAGRYLS